MQITTNIEPELYEKAVKKLSESGVTIDELFKDMITQIVAGGACYLPLIPNAETIAAIEEAEKGGLPSAKRIDELMEKLNEGD